MLYGAYRGFNTQPPEGGWLRLVIEKRKDQMVSTHSRPKAAGFIISPRKFLWPVSTHSRPKAAGIARLKAELELLVSTHSRPKAAG